MTATDPYRQGFSPVDNLLFRMNQPQRLAALAEDPGPTLPAGSASIQALGDQLEPGSRAEGMAVWKELCASPASPERDADLFALTRIVARGTGEGPQRCREASERLDDAELRIALLAIAILHEAAAGSVRPASSLGSMGDLPSSLAVDTQLRLAIAFMHLSTDKLDLDVVETALGGDVPIAPSLQLRVLLVRAHARAVRGDRAGSFALWAEAARRWGVALCHRAVDELPVAWKVERAGLDRAYLAGVQGEVRFGRWVSTALLVFAAAFAGTFVLSPWWVWLFFALLALGFGLGARASGRRLLRLARGQSRAGTVVGYERSHRGTERDHMIRLQIDLEDGTRVLSHRDYLPKQGLAFLNRSVRVLCSPSDRKYGLVIGGERPQI